MKKEYLEKYELCIKEGDLDRAPLYLDYILYEDSENEDIENVDIEIFKELIPLYFKYIEMMVVRYGGTELTDDGDRFYYYEELIKIYIRAEAYDQAVKYFTDELFDLESEMYGGVSLDIISIYKYMPCFYHKLGYIEKEIASSKKLYDMLVELLKRDFEGEMGYVGEIYFDMGQVLKTLNQYQKAIEYFESTIKYFETNEVYDEYIVEAYDNIIELYELLRNEEMIKLYNEKKINL